MLQRLTLAERLEVMARRHVNLGVCPDSFVQGLRYAKTIVGPKGWEEIAPAWVPEEIKRKAEKR